MVIADNAGEQYQSILIHDIVNYIILEGNRTNHDEFVRFYF